MPSSPANSFEPVFEAHWASTLKLAYRMTGDAHEAEEIAQQTFFLAYRAWPKFEQRSSVKTWLFRIAVNTCKKHMARQREEISLEEAPPPIAREEASIATRELRERLDAAMQALSPRHRMVLTLFCLDDLDHTAIAEILGCPIGTVWSRLFNARAALAKILSPEPQS